MPADLISFSRLLIRFWVLGIFCLLTGVQVLATDPGSVYTLRPDDPEAFYFTPENYNITSDGKTDVSDALQLAINQVKKEKNFGILFIPEGRYRISRTIYVPGAIRLIGYGRRRPEFILAANSPGYQEEIPGNRGDANYMFWFTANLVVEDDNPRDAGAGTFYSAMSNINLRIEDGNPNAIALRTHYAQHGFISHVNIYTGNGKAGLLDVGNEMENVAFFGGDYGIYTRRPSPGWPMMMVDTYFEGQKKAAIWTQDAGFAIVGMHVKNTPVGIEMRENTPDRLFLENCLLENVHRTGIIVSVEDNSMSQLNLLNVECKNVPVLLKFRESGKEIKEPAKVYKINDLSYGLIMDDLASDSEFKLISDIVPVNQISEYPDRSIPALPAMEKWINIRNLGAKGDGETDDTKVFRDAIASYQNIYVPQGWYRITGTLKLRPGTRLIGLHPFATQLVLKESEPAFSGFGNPVPLVESSEGGADIINGIGLKTGGYNYRAVGCKWMAGTKSLLNDIKFVGGHGTMRKPVQEDSEGGRSSGRWRWRNREISSPTNPVYERGKDEAWDNQYWSLWVTNNGGGTLKDIWTANTYAANGLYINNSSTPGRIYAMSLEHHVRNEARFANVSNWKMYAFQFEEEGVEGKDCLMVDISRCSNLLFANQWMYRTIRVSTPQPVGVRISESRNIQFRNLHNYTQKLQVVEFPVYEMNEKLPAYPWDFAMLTVTGEEKGDQPDLSVPWKIEILATGFIFGTGLTSDSKGNVYFCEHDRKRIYRWSTETKNLRMLTDHPWKPFTLATDTEDNLLVVFRYDPQPGYLVNGEQERVPRLPDDNPGYSGWGNSGWAAWAYSFDPENPDGSFNPMERIPSEETGNMEKALYPSSRWRGDFDKNITFTPENNFIAPDGVTIIPEIYDLGRSASLSDAIPGQPLYVVREIDKTTVKLEVDEQGKLSGMQEIVPRGEYDTAVDPDGNLYIADGQIFVYDKNFREIKRISLDERPISIVIGGKDRNILFVTTHSSLYGIRIR